MKNQKKILLRKGYYLEIMQFGFGTYFMLFTLFVLYMISKNFCYATLQKKSIVLWSYLFLITERTLLFC